jgi:hypothetical protein
MRIWAIAILALYCGIALACPYCAGNGQEGKDSNTTLILSLFIAFCYIPYAIIWRLIKKSRQMREQPPV